MHKNIPLLRWTSDYSTQSALLDFIAGLTVGLTVLPQALAYSTLAGLEPQVSAFKWFNFNYFLIRTQTQNPLSVWPLFGIHGLLRVRHIWRMSWTDHWTDCTAGTDDQSTHGAGRCVRSAFGRSAVLFVGCRTISDGPSESGCFGWFDITAGDGGFYVRHCCHHWNVSIEGEAALKQINI